MNLTSSDMGTKVSWGRFTNRFNSIRLLCRRSLSWVTVSKDFFQKNKVFSQITLKLSYIRFSKAKSELVKHKKQILSNKAFSNEAGNFHFSFLLNFYRARAIWRSLTNSARRTVRANTVEQRTMPRVYFLMKDYI